MSFHSFVYSDERRYRLARHFVLWVAYAAWFTLQSYYPTRPTDGISWFFIKVAFLSTAMYFPFCFLIAYTLLYYLYPIYIRSGRFVWFFVNLLLFTLAGICMNFWISRLFFRYSDRAMIPAGELYLGTHNVVIGIIVSIFLLGLRLGRNAYIQQKANLMLAAQKARAELQLLKTRIDPGFLFSTLEDIRVKLDAGSSEAPAMILGLSDNLSNILYGEDGDAAPNALDDLPFAAPPQKPEDAAYQIPVTGADKWIHDLIFSKKPWIRYSRHLLFWFLRFSFLTFSLHTRNYMLPSEHWLTWFDAWKTALFETFAEMTLTYTIVYWLYPLWFHRKKYLPFFLGTLTILVVVFLVTNHYQFRYVYQHLDASPRLMVWYDLMDYLRLSFVTWLLFLAVRMFKEHEERIRERQTLNKETADVEFQLLKAQVHPHFLFNILNNIYSFALKGSPRAGELVARLLDMLRYMINDCEAARMPLNRELALLTDYIGLENARYGDRLDMQVDIRGDTRSYKIAPLLMIPFLENCYKHGASQVLDHPWVRLQISTGEHMLDFRLSNNKPFSATATGGKNGIGLKNIRQRLELLYSGQYRLEIDDGDDCFSVHMLVPLEDNDPSPVSIKHRL